MLNLLSSKITAAHTFPIENMHSCISIADYSRRLHALVDGMFQTWPKTILPLKSCSSKDMTRYVNNVLESAGERFSDIDVTARIIISTEASHIQILAEDDLGIVDIEILVDIDWVSKNIKQVLKTFSKDIQEGREFLPGGVVYKVSEPSEHLEPDCIAEVITVRKGRLVRPSQPSKDILDFYYGVHKIKG